MKQQLHVDNPEFWHDVMCAHVLNARCKEVSPDFLVDFEMWQPSSLRATRITSVPHHWDRLERHVRNTNTAELVIYVQTRGSAVQLQDGKEVVLQPGDITCVDSTRPMEMRIGSDFQQTLIHIPRDLVLDEFGETERFTSVELGADSRIAPLLKPFMLNLGDALDAVPAKTAEQLIHTGTSLILCSLGERCNRKDRETTWDRNALRYRAKAYIRRSSRDIELNSARAAKALRISLRYLQTLFHSEGSSPSEFLWDCRLENSRQDLINAGWLRGLSVRSHSEAASRMWPISAGALRRSSECRPESSVQGTQSKPLAASFLRHYRNADHAFNVFA
jgi:AraC-like DNA-binding protein